MTNFHINNPIPQSLASECQKAARILNDFINPGQGLDVIIPPDILTHAQGLVVFTVLKAGCIFSGRAGSGLVISRLPNGSWSAPSAIMTAGFGAGGQIGAELTDFVMVLTTRDAVKTFMDFGTITLGTNISVAAGPTGRNAEASGALSIRALAAAYSYSKTKGIFAGVSLEGSVMFERRQANSKMYGRSVTARELLSGSVPPPPQADYLYRALDLKFHTGGIYNQPYFDATAATEHPSSFDSQQRSDEPPRFSRANIHQMAAGGGYGRSGAGNGYNNDYVGSNGTDMDYYSSPSPYSNAVVRASTPPQQTLTSSLTRARASFNFRGERSSDLSFRKGDIIIVTKMRETTETWWKGRLEGGDGHEGDFPANFVELL